MVNANTLPSTLALQMVQALAVLSTPPNFPGPRLASSMVTICTMIDSAVAHQAIHISLRFTYVGAQIGEILQRMLRF